MPKVKVIEGPKGLGRMFYVIKTNSEYSVTGQGVEFVEYLMISEVRQLLKRLNVHGSFYQHGIFGRSRISRETKYGNVRYTQYWFYCLPKIVLSLEKNKEICEKLRDELMERQYLLLDECPFNIGDLIVMTDVYRDTTILPDFLNLGERILGYQIHDNEFILPDVASLQKRIRSNAEMVLTLDIMKKTKTVSYIFSHRFDDVDITIIAPDVIKIMRCDDNCICKNDKSLIGKIQGKCMLVGDFKKKECYGYCANKGRYELEYRERGNHESLLESIKFAYDEHRIHLIHHKAENLTLERLSLIVLDALEEHGYRREPETGNILVMVENRPYWYIQHAKPKDFINFVLMDQPKMATSPDYLTKLVRILKSNDLIRTPFVHRDRNMIGYRNGALDAMTMTFHPLELMNDTLKRARVCFDVDYSENAETPIFDDFLQAQFGDNDGQKTLFMTHIGALFFDRRDSKWNSVMNIYGDGHSTALDIIADMQDSRKVAHILNGKELIGKMRKSDLVVVHEATHIHSTHPIFPLQTSSKGDTLHDYQEDGVSFFTSPYVIFSPQPLADFHRQHPLVRFLLPVAFGGDLEAESGFITLKCLRQLHQYAPGNDMIPNQIEGVNNILPSGRSILVLFFEEHLQYDLQNAFGTPLKDIRQKYREFLIQKDLLDMIKSHPIERNTFAKFHPQCIAYQPKSCQVCQTPFKKGVTCCSSFKKRSLSDHIKYISIK